MLVGDHGFKLFAAQEVMGEQGVGAPEPPQHTGLGTASFPRILREQKMRVFETAG